MDPKQIRQLIELISRSDFAEFELHEKDFSLKLVKQQAPSVVAAPGAAAYPSAPGQVTAPAPELAVPAAAETPEEAPPAVPSGAEAVLSPIVGTFYRSAGPDSPPFVEVGSKVHKGQVLCIVEAMKVMNEIESEIDAEVVDVLVANGQPVEYGEVLFQLRPSN